MLKKIQELKESLCVYAATNSKTEQISNSNWKILAKCVKALQPYEKMTKHLSGSSASISDVIPFVVSLKTTLQSTSWRVVDAQSTGSYSESESHNITDEEETTNVINFMKQTMRAEVGPEGEDM